MNFIFGFVIGTIFGICWVSYKLHQSHQYLIKAENRLSRSNFAYDQANQKNIEIMEMLEKVTNSLKTSILAKEMIQKLKELR